ncbi:MAG: DUF2267 domain-containing protein [Anaerolineales bacterium]|nr:DUF2267 domain-containing protein [Anaerolineales bacterium]
MDELVKLVAQKAGIPEKSARTAAETVLNFLKQRLPAPIAGQLDALVAGANADQISSAAAGLGNLLGKK